MISDGQVPHAPTGSAGDDVRRRRAPSTNVLGIAGQNHGVSIEGHDGDVPVDHVACAMGCRRQHAHASARFSVERQLRHEIARPKARNSGLPVPTSPNLSLAPSLRPAPEYVTISRSEGQSEGIPYIGVPQ
jgi:hypothetical protein